MLDRKIWIANYTSKYFASWSTEKICIIRLEFFQIHIVWWKFFEKFIILMAFWQNFTYIDFFRSF